MPDDSENQKAASNTRRRPRRPRDTAENAIAASRRSRKSTRTASPAAAETPPSGPPSLSEEGRSSPQLRRPDSDPWTVPQSVRDRFIQEGNRFYFSDGHEAFKDRGRKLTTASENTEVVRSLVEIARSRGWTEVTLSGSDQFRRQAWQQARLAGLNVRGYRPSDEERIQLIRAIGRGRESAGQPVDSISTEMPNPEAYASADRKSERIQGKLLEHGKDFYRHDPNEAQSYFVRLDTPNGRREVWGKDIERAIQRSLSQPKVGDDIVLKRTGRETVKIKRRDRDEQGELRERDVEAFKIQWSFETQAFLQSRREVAQIVRNSSVAPRDATQRYPELAGTYLGIRAAELASASLRDPEDRRRFVAQVRRALADDIELGEPLLPVRLRNRAPTRGRPTPRRVESPEMTR